jgi:hypothetical protein
MEYAAIEDVLAVVRLDPIIVVEVKLILECCIHNSHGLAMGVIHVDGVAALLAHPGHL